MHYHPHYSSQISNKGSSNVNVTLIHCNIFSAMKLKDPTLKIITPHNDIIDTLLKFSDRNNYTKIFNKIFKYSTISRIYISYHIKLKWQIGELKHGRKQDKSNIFDSLVNNDSFLSHDKFQSHKECLIEFFVNISLLITFRYTIREKIQDTLM